MKTKDSIIIFAACVALTAGEYSTNAQLLFDDFNDSVINTNLWQISLPFAGSQAFETNGRAVMIARGSFDTKQSFPPSIVVRGRFKFSGTEDFFQVALRSDLASLPHLVKDTESILSFLTTGRMSESLNILQQTLLILLRSKHLIFL